MMLVNDTNFMMLVFYYYDCHDVGLLYGMVWFMLVYDMNVMMLVYDMSVIVMMLVYDMDVMMLVYYKNRLFTDSGYCP